jgi:hypothetical protein
LTAREAVFAFSPAAVPVQHPRGRVPGTGTGQDAPDTARAVVRMQLLGANPVPQVTGLEERAGKVHYVRGNDPQQWQTHVPTYAKVHYTAVYPGIDLVYYGQPRQLEYDFRIVPGTDPTVITLGFAGIDRIDVDAQGDLVLATAGRSLRFQKPVIYQEGNGYRHAVAGSDVCTGPHQVGFHVAAYDPARPLVIDPVLSYATYLGGSGFDFGTGIAVNAAGAAYVTGLTHSPDFPTMPGAFQVTSGTRECSPRGVDQNAFVVKLASPTFVGTPGTANRHGESVSALVHQYGSLEAAASALGFPSVQAPQDAIQEFCEG